MLWTAEKRLEVLREVEKGASVREVCHRHGISRQTYYNWKKRFERDGLAGLKDKSRAPKHPHPRQTPPEKIQRVRGYALEHPSMTIHEYANALGIPKSTIHRILKAEKISTKQGRQELLEKLSQERQLSSEQFAYLLERNPAWNDFAHDWGDVNPQKIWQLGTIRKSPKDFLMICIHTYTGYLAYFHLIANPKYDNRLPIYVERLVEILRNSGDIIARNDTLRARLQREIHVPDIFILTGIADQAPYGMFQAFEAWLKMFKRYQWEQTDQIRDTWNTEPKPYYPFFGRSPREVLEELVRDIRRKGRGNG